MNKLSVMKNVPLPAKFTISRNQRRFNMAEYDRKVFYSFNLFSLFLFSLPILYMSKVNYKMCEENEMIYKKLNKTGITPSRNLFAP